MELFNEKGEISLSIVVDLINHSDDKEFIILLLELLNLKLSDSWNTEGGMRMRNKFFDLNGLSSLFDICLGKKGNELISLGFSNLWGFGDVKINRERVKIKTKIV